MPHFALEGGWAQLAVTCWLGVQAKQVLLAPASEVGLAVCLVDVDGPAVGVVVAFGAVDFKLFLKSDFELPSERLLSRVV